MIPFMSWRPDIAGIATPYASNVRNVLPESVSEDGAVTWGPFPEFASLVSPAEGPILSARGFTMPNGSQQIVVGTATKLFLLDPSTDTLEDVSGATYSASTLGRWHFEVYGQNIIAVNPSDSPQRLLVGTDATFSDLGGSPSRGQLVSVWKDQLVIANLNSNTESLQWSEINDITDWSGGNADTQLFPGFGAITAISRGNTNFVIQEYGIQRGIFTGSDAVFEFDTLSEDFGCRRLNATVFRENRAYFASNYGFKAISLDGTVEHIGHRKVDVWASANVDLTKDVVAVADPIRPIIYWGVTASNEVSTGTINTLLAYNTILREWSRIAVDLEWLFPWRQQIWTLEELDALGTLNSIDIPLNSQAWAAALPLIGGADGAHRIGQYSGAPKAATIATAEFSGRNGRRSRLKAARPLINTSACTLKHSGRENRGDSFVSANPQPVFARTQEARINRTARWHSLELEVEGGAAWSLASGVEATID